MEQLLIARLNDARNTIRSKYDRIESANPDDPIRTVFTDEIEDQFKALRDNLNDDEIVQIQSRIDELKPNIVRVRPEVVDPTRPTGHIFLEAEDEFYFLRRLLE